MNASLLVAADSSGNCHVYELKNTEELIPLQKLEAHCDYILKCLNVSLSELRRNYNFRSLAYNSV